MAEKLRQLLTSDNWRKRRRYMTVVLAWAMLNVQYLIVFGTDNALNQNIAIALVTLIASIIGTYVFGATWDDTDKRKNAAQAPDEPQ